MLICIMQYPVETSFTNYGGFDSHPQQHQLLRKQLYCACTKFYSGVQLFGQSTSHIHPVGFFEW